VSPNKKTFAFQKTQHDITGTGINISELPTTIANRDPRQYPFLLMLDEILDPGNLGAILRTAYFLGCSALVVSERNCAPLSPTCLKTSAGASEYMPILTQVNPMRFISASQRHGWKFFAAVPPTGRTSRKTVKLEDDGVRQALKKGPTVLVMGSEGEGLRETVKKACDKWVSIQSARDVDKGVDSLNVSVAAGVLCRNFLMK
jgi:21S rRNA (GM2251-2'-O)-methyltransferase